MPGKGQATATLTEAAKDTQTFAWCVEIGYDTPLRLTTAAVKVTVDSDVYYPWHFNVSKIETSEDLIENMTLAFQNAELEPPLAFQNAELGPPYTAQRLTELDYSDDPVGKTVTVYRVQITAGNVQSEETYFSGTIDGSDCSEKQWRIQCQTVSSLTSMRGSNVDIGLCTWSIYGNADCAITPTYGGSGGLDDMSVEAFGEPLGWPRTYVITITTAGAQDKFDWTVDGGGGAANVNCSTSAITLGDEGFQISFGAITGHTAGGTPDTWTIDAKCRKVKGDCDGTMTDSTKSNELRFGGFPHAPEAGESITIPGVVGTVPKGSYDPRGWGIFPETLPKAVVNTIWEDEGAIQTTTVPTTTTTTTTRHSQTRNRHGDPNYDGPTGSGGDVDPDDPSTWEEGTY